MRLLPSIGMGVALAGILLGGAVPAGRAAAASPACKGSQLGGTFRGIAGSAGAGHISYALRLKNTSTTSCFVTGIPGLTLLDETGHRLPTHVRPAHPGALTAVLVTLAPGRSAIAEARFSPDVPGPGEQVMGACEQTAYKLRVTMPGGGTVLAPIAPATPVCEHGAMQLSVLTRA